MVIYKTNSWDGYGKHNYYWNEYRLEGDTVYKVKCHEFKSFDGEENNWYKEERNLGSWNVDDDCMPEWLRKHL